LRDSIKRISGLDAKINGIPYKTEQELGISKKLKIITTPIAKPIAKSPEP
jgi:hypothetical protein